MARTPPRSLVVILLAIAVSLPLFSYTWHKLLHILGAVLFLGNLIVTAAWMTWAVQRKDSSVVAFASAGVNQADQWFSSPGVILLLFNGLAMTALAYGGWLGFTTTGWILAGLILLVASAVVFAAGIRRYQVAMMRISSEAAQAGAPLPAEFSGVFRKWAFWGIVATILPLIALYFMVAKPTI